MIRLKDLKSKWKLKITGDKEAMSFDEDYVIALEHGMPPAVGVGVGVDRFGNAINESNFYKRRSSISSA